MLSEHDKHLLCKLGRLTSIGVITQTDISKGTGVHQSQVSRILAGHSKRQSPNLKKICAYAESMHYDADVPAGVPQALARELADFLGVKSGEEERIGDILIALRRWRSDWRHTS
jgi:transcriptional regulator with XRE-family HTH domain